MAPSGSHGFQRFSPPRPVLPSHFVTRGHVQSHTWERRVRRGMFVLKQPHSRLINKKKHDSCGNNSFFFPFFFFKLDICVGRLNIHLFYSRRIVLERRTEARLTLSHNAVAVCHGIRASRLGTNAWTVALRVKESSKFSCRSPKPLLCLNFYCFLQQKKERKEAVAVSVWVCVYSTKRRSNCALFLFIFFLPRSLSTDVFGSLLKV